MQRTVEDKYKYNKGRRDEFSEGYCIGVDVYRNYVKLDDGNKLLARKAIDGFMQNARKGDLMSKGIIAGYRDAANERKARQNRLS